NVVGIWDILPLISATSLITALTSTPISEVLVSSAFTRASRSGGMPPLSPPSRSPRNKRVVAMRGAASGSSVVCLLCRPLEHFVARCQRRRYSAFKVLHCSPDFPRGRRCADARGQQQRPQYTDDAKHHHQNVRADHKRSALYAWPDDLEPGSRRTLLFVGHGSPADDRQRKRPSPDGDGLSL